MNISVNVVHLGQIVLVSIGGGEGGGGVQVGTGWIP